MPAVQLASAIHTQSTHHVFRFRFDSLTSLLTCSFVELAPYFHNVTKGSVGRMTVCEVEPFRQDDDYELEFRVSLIHDVPHAISSHIMEQRLLTAQRVARKRYASKPWWSVCCVFSRSPVPRSHHVYVYS